MVSRHRRDAYDTFGAGLGPCRVDSQLYTQHRPEMKVFDLRHSSASNIGPIRDLAIFIATLWAGASRLFFGVALSTRISKIWVFVRALKRTAN